MGKERLWIISELFYPLDTSTSYIMTRIADFMSKHFDVQVLTGPSQYDSEIEETNKDDGQFTFKINRVNVGNFSKNRLVSRIMRFSLITISFCWFMFWNVKRGEKVFIVTNPAFFIVTAACLKLFKGFHLYILIHDVFPENLVPAGIIQRENVFYSLIKKVFDWAYDKADELVVLGIDMKRVMLEKTALPEERVHVVQNWAELERINVQSMDDNSIVLNEGLSDKLVLVFAGNIGRLQGVDVLVELIKRVENDSIHFLFVGDGAIALKIKELSDSNPRVSYLGRMPRDRQNDFLNAGCIGIVSLNDKMKGLGVPSKSYNILSAGRPILFIGDNGTEIASMITANDLGWVFNQSQVDEMLKFLNSLDKTHYLLNLENKNRIRRFAEENCSELKMSQKLKRIIEA